MCYLRKQGDIKTGRGDHIVPYPVCGDFFDSTNWQSLCSKCNAEKGNKDKKIIQEFKRNGNSSKNS